MSGFEYIFTFYGLLLGLAIANATNNLAEMWRSSEVVKVGLTPPILCVVILLSGAQQWVSFWSARDDLTMTTDSLLMSIGMALPYIFVSHGMTPAREGSGSFEEFYLRHRRTLMGVLTIPPVLSLAYNLALSGVPAPLDQYLLYVAVVLAPRILIPLGLAFSRSPRVHAIGLAVLALHTLARLFEG